MPNLKDNLKQWRDSARIDWFSQFIRAWIPFNAWMTDTYGDLSDRELLDKVKASGNVIYLDESKGLPVGSVWDDINSINSQAKESLGYPTQKPLPLLERILKTSSNENDIVLDAFCGCGTALVAAQI